MSGFYCFLCKENKDETSFGGFYKSASVCICCYEMVKVDEEIENEGSVHVRSPQEANTEHISGIFDRISEILDRIKSLETRLDSYNNTEGEDI